MFYIIEKKHPDYPVNPACPAKSLRIRASNVNLLLIIALHIYPAKSAFNWGAPISL